MTKYGHELNRLPMCKRHVMNVLMCATRFYCPLFSLGGVLCRGGVLGGDPAGPPELPHPPAASTSGSETGVKEFMAGDVS